MSSRGGARRREEATGGRCGPPQCRWAPRTLARRRMMRLPVRRRAAWTTSGGRRMRPPTRRKLQRPLAGRRPPTADLGGENRQSLRRRLNLVRGVVGRAPPPWGRHGTSTSAMEAAGGGRARESAQELDLARQLAGRGGERGERRGGGGRHVALSGRSSDADPRWRGGGRSACLAALRPRRGRMWGREGVVGLHMTIGVRRQRTGVVP
jgi:hypothetical protein